MWNRWSPGVARDFNAVPARMKARDPALYREAFKGSVFNHDLLRWRIDSIKATAGFFRNFDGMEILRDAEIRGAIWEKAEGPASAAKNSPNIFTKLFPPLRLVFVEMERKASLGTDSQVAVLSSRLLLRSPSMLTRFLHWIVYDVQLYARR